MRATRPTIPWATGAGGGLATWAVAVALSAAGCGDDVAVQGIAFELAASTTNGAAACLEAVAALPDTVDCVGISLCQREGTGCTPIPLSRPGGSPHMGEPLLVPLDANRAVRFDAPIPDGDVEMEVVVYADGAAIAEGSGLLSRGAAPAVLLHPYEAASCAGGGTDGVAPRSRALHAAMAMPNGDVLIFGGVSGERVPVYGLALGARLQRGVDVFLGREGRFAPVTVIGAGAVEGGLGRVLFTAIPLDAAADGRQRIRLLGGLTVDGDTPAMPAKV